MKRLLLFQRFFAAVLLLAVSTLSWALVYDYDVEIDGIYYFINDDDATAGVAGAKFSYSVVIPSAILQGDNTWYSVTSIVEDAFSGCTTLTSITIPSSVTNIGISAFSGCTSLTSITIPNSVTSIGSHAFMGCSGLTSVTIGNSVTGIGSHAFENCSNLTSVTIGNSVTSIGGSAFENCSGLTSITIPNSVTSIGWSAFSGCTGLTSITIPNSVTSIGSEAFRGCYGLTSITIPNSVTRINRHAFYGCSGLTSVTIPNSVTSIGNCAFESCSGLTSVTIPNSVTSIEYQAFRGCSGLTSVTIPNSVTSIGYSAFSGCSGLSSVTIPNSVTSIGDGAFGNCSKLTSVTLNSSLVSNRPYNVSMKSLFGNQVKEYIIGEDVTSIGYGAFSDCSGLTSVTIPNSVTSIGEYVFSGCSGLTSLTIPNSVTSIGDDAFANCSGLTSITIPNSVTSIGVYAFKDCSSLTSVSIPYDVTVIWEGLFMGCSALTHITIPNSVTLIRYAAFEGCINLTSITIPSNVTAIGFRAFKDCSNLTSIIIPNSVKEFGYNAFENCVELKKVICQAQNVPTTGSNCFSGITLNSATLYVPASSIELYKSADQWKNFGTILPIEEEEPDEGNRIKGIYYEFDTENNTAAVVSGEVKYTGDVVIPETIVYQGNTYTVTSIANSAFRECTDLTSVTIPNSVTTINGRAFYGCSSLSTVTIPNSVTSIGGWAFFDTAWYDNQPDGLVYTGKVAYKYKGTLPENAHITIKEGTLGIAGSAFYNCTGLTSVTIPGSVTTIGDEVFAYCSGLTSVTCYAEKVPSTGINCFTSVPQSSVTLYVPLSSVSAYKSAFQWKNFGTILPIGHSEPYKPFSTSEVYYLYNQEADMYLCPGNSYDTQASVGEAGMDMLFEDAAGEDEIFSIGDTQCAAYAVNTRIYNSATAHYMGMSGDGASAYFDQEPAAWYFVPQEDGTFLLSSNTTGNYLYYDGVHTALSITTDASEKGARWHVLTREDIISRMAAATADEPVNVSSLISYADFSRNGKLRVGVWQGNPSRGGNNSNFCAEKFDCNFNVYQILTDLPNGVYKVKAQAYYREGADQNYNPIPAAELRKNGNEHLYARLYANNQEVPVKSIFDETDRCIYGYQTELGIVPNSISNAATAFLQGLYWNELTVKVSDGTLQLGIKKDEYVFYDWTCFDSFRLYYYGQDRNTGDANGNGEVEIGDVTSVLTLMATPEAIGYDKKAADANGNGEIEIGDVTTILTIMAGE